MSHLLNLLGWSSLNSETISKLEEHKKLILVFQHTSKWDAFLYALYYMKYEIIRRRAYTLVTPRIGNSEILKQFGFIPATDVDKKGGGMTKSIIDTVSKLDEYMIIISPKGCITNRPWRSGYYHLAKELGCEIVCGGFDYDQKKFVFKEPFIIGNKTLEEVNTQCQNNLKDITPLVSSRMEFELSESVKKKNITPISVWKVALYSILMISLIVLITTLVIYLFERNSRHGPEIIDTIVKDDYAVINT